MIVSLPVHSRVLGESEESIVMVSDNPGSQAASSKAKILSLPARYCTKQ
jgi:hypothetical protein